MDADSTDPRHFQVGVLAALVVFGIAGLDFAIRPARAAAVLAAAFATRYAGTKLANVTGRDIADIRAKMPAPAATAPEPEPWWRRLRD